MSLASKVALAVLLAVSLMLPAAIPAAAGSQYTCYCQGQKYDQARCRGGFPEMNAPRGTYRLNLSGYDMIKYLTWTYAQPIAYGQTTSAYAPTTGWKCSKN